MGAGSIQGLPLALASNGPPKSGTARYTAGMTGATLLLSEPC